VSEKISHRGLPMVYVDVDLTLIDAQGNLLAGVKKVLEELNYRYDLVCWSHGGLEYAEKILDDHAIRHYFCAVLAKPFGIIDDCEDYSLPRSFKVNIFNWLGWRTVWNQIFQKTVNNWRSVGR
jgi:phosphoglycolate phosphatase-like HAD superfamily hydrolase